MCIGIAHGNRTVAHLLNRIGLYLNLLPLRFRSQSTQTFNEALKETQLKVLSALANSRLPFNVLLNELIIPRTAIHSPLFQTFVDYRKTARHKQAFGDCELHMTNFDVGRTPYDLSLDIIDDVDDQCLLILMVQENLYNHKDAEILMQSYVNSLASFAENSNTSLEEPEIFNKADVERAIELGRGKHPLCYFCQLRLA